MKDSYKRINRHYKRLQAHPITSEKPFLHIWRYLNFNIRSSVVHEQTISWINNLKLYVRKGDAGLVGNIYYGLYEFEESLFLLHFIEKNDLFLDIGANLGHYSLLVSGIKECKSIAIEPVPATFKQLVRNIELNKLDNRIKALQIGIADKEGVLCFSTDRNTMDRIVSPTYKNSIEVPVRTIDDVIEKEMPVAIKMDVEGYELYALNGAHRTLSSPALKVVILELNKSGEKYGVEDEDIFQLMLSYGFKPFGYDTRNRNLIELKTYNVHKFNTLFIRDIDFVQKRLAQSEKIKIRNKKF